MSDTATGLRVVLDTSVLVSDERHWLWFYAHDGYYEAVWSTIIVTELVRVRMRLAMRQGVEESVQRRRIYNLVHRLSDVLTVADYRGILLDATLPDPDDDPILATALASGAQYVVSLNVKHFPPGNMVMHVRFITPTDFLTVLDEMYPDANLTQHVANAGKQLHSNTAPYSVSPAVRYTTQTRGDCQSDLLDPRRYHPKAETGRAKKSTAAMA